MFRTELRKFGRLYQLNATISRPQSAPDGETASWTIETKAGDWQTRTSYDFLRFEDLIQRDLAAPIVQTVLHAVCIYWRLVFGGTIARFWKANWRFATFITYPHLLLLAEASCAEGWPSPPRSASRRWASPHHWGLRGRSCFYRAARQRSKIHGKPDLSAVFTTRHHLDLGIFSPPAPGMGPTNRPV